ncbi:hypothetical protein TNCV_1352231 [Trichonephila clavipes]|nr:hypothetical protein TNCV_1352231 [Trichonephila clavipes]
MKLKQLLAKKITPFCIDNVIVKNAEVNPEFYIEIKDPFNGIKILRNKNIVIPVQLVNCLNPTNNQIIDNIEEFEPEVNIAEFNFDTDESEVSQDNSDSNDPSWTPNRRGNRRRTRLNPRVRNLNSSNITARNSSSTDTDGSIEINSSRRRESPSMRYDRSCNTPDRYRYDRFRNSPHRSRNSCSWNFPHHSSNSPHRLTDQSRNSSHRFRNSCSWNFPHHSSNSPHRLTDQSRNYSSDDSENSPHRPKIYSSNCSRYNSRDRIIKYVINWIGNSNFELYNPVSPTDVLNPVSPPDVLRANFFEEFNNPVSPTDVLRANFFEEFNNPVSPTDVLRANVLRAFF